MDIQRLRCKVNFKALIFVPHIRTLGDALVNRLRYPSDDSRATAGNYLREVTDSTAKEAGKFVVLHLRFDKVLPTLVGLITVVALVILES